MLYVELPTSLRRIFHIYISCSFFSLMFFVGGIYSSLEFLTALISGIHDTAYEKLLGVTMCLGTSFALWCIGYFAYRMKSGQSPFRVKWSLTMLLRSQ